jgi:hypothetical protein
MQASPNLGRTICPRGPALFQELVASAVSNLEQFLAVHYMTIAGKQRSHYGVFTPYYVLGATDKLRPRFLYHDTIPDLFADFDV